VVAERYLENPVQFNSVRNMLGYTGTYKGVEVSVMGSGMGIPSIGIYAHELYGFYDVDAIIRIGSAGGLDPRTNLRDIVIAQGACTDSNFGAMYHLPGTFAPIASYDLLETSVAVARERGTNALVGNVISSDHFYHAAADADAASRWQGMGVLAVEMETAGLYLTAMRLHKKALALFQISDHIFTGEMLTPQEIRTGFRNMMEIALKTAIRV
jgi:purine-nucleoside phosphorylase